MRKVHPAAWIGLVINIVVAAAMLDEYPHIAVLPVILFIAVGLSAVGIVMLAMGSPFGGILGAIGGAIFAPIGLICVVGCIRSRQRLKKPTGRVWNLPRF